MRIKEIVETVVKIISIAGFLFTAGILMSFLLFPRGAIIEVGDNEVYIRGVPFTWIITSLFFMHVRNAYTSASILIQSILKIFK